MWDPNSAGTVSDNVLSYNNTSPSTGTLMTAELFLIRKSLARFRASKLTTTNIYIKRARCERQQAVVSSGLNAHWLIIGMGHWVHDFSLILNSSVSLSAGIRSAGDLVPETLVRILHSAEEDNLSPPFDLKIASPCQSIKFNNNKLAYMSFKVS